MSKQEIPQEKANPQTKNPTLEEKILEIEKQMAELNGGKIADKKSSEPELTADEKEGGVVKMLVEYDNPRKAVNFLSGKSSDDLELEEKARRLKALRIQLEELASQEAKNLRDEAIKNQPNQGSENEENRGSGIITFGSYEEAKEYGEKMAKAYERLGIPCDLQYNAEQRCFLMKLPPQCRGKDVFSMSPEELAALRDSIAQSSVTVNKELDLGGSPLLDAAPTNNNAQLENGFAVTLESLDKKLAELASRKGGMRAEGDTDDDLKAQVAAIEALQEAVKSRMTEQLEREQGIRGREKSDDFVQIAMVQNEENAKKLAVDLKNFGIDCSVVEKNGVFGVKIELSNEILKGESSDVVNDARPGSPYSPSSSARNAGIDSKSPALVHSNSVNSFFQNH